MQGAPQPPLYKDHSYTLGGAATRTFHVKRSAVAERSLRGSPEEQHRVWRAHGPWSQEASGRRDVGCGNTEQTGLGPPSTRVWRALEFFRFGALSAPLLPSFPLGFLASQEAGSHISLAHLGLSTPNGRASSEAGLELPVSLDLQVTS